MNFNPISRAPTIPRIPSSLKWSFFFRIPQADSTPALINSHHRYTVNTGTKKWKIFRVIPDPFDSSNSFFFFLQNPSIYRDCLFLARFLSLRSILFQIFQLPLCKVSKVFISIFPSSFFKFSFANSYLFYDFSSPVSYSFDFPSPFSQSIQSIYCDFSSSFKFPFTNNVFITIFLRFLSSVSIIQLLFCKVSKVFIAIFPRPFPFVLYPSPIFFSQSILLYLLRYSFPFVLYPSPIFFSQSILLYLLPLFLARFPSRGQPTSASKFSIILRRNDDFPPPPRFVITRFLSLVNALRKSKDAAEILLQT